MPPIPRNDQTLKIPCSPSLGSQKLRPVSHGLRGNDPGGYALPRSSRQTEHPRLGEALRHHGAAEAGTDDDDVEMAFRG